jgi:carbon monoxide dehydrogenase subunit G
MERSLMEFTGRYTIPASPDLVWAALNDPEILRSCIPGCETLVKSGDSEFEGSARIKVGPVSATFRGKVALAELNPPHRLVLKGEGQGGVAGFAKGDAEVLLTPAEGGTQLAYTAKANVGGKLAQIGQRLIDGAAKQIADDFFKRFSGALTPALPADPLTQGAVGGSGSSVAAAADAHRAPSAAERRREGLAPQVWVVGLIGVIVILLVLFGVAL